MPQANSNDAHAATRANRSVSLTAFEYDSRKACKTWGVEASCFRLEAPAETTAEREMALVRRGTSNRSLLRNRVWLMETASALALGYQSWDEFLKRGAYPPSCQENTAIATVHGRDQFADQRM